MSADQQGLFVQGKIPRNEVPLPPLYFVAMDDWLEKLGNDAFLAYLRMWTFCDRRESEREYDKIPYSLKSTWEKLGMGKKKFYEKIIRPLWNFGLIDIVEYEEAARHTQKPKNIIVYKYPQNRFELAKEPLQKVRDYDKDYSSESVVFGRKGGRPKVEGLDDSYPQNPQEESNGFQTETVENERFPNGNGRDNGFQTETVTVSKRKPNNVFNNLLKKDNKSINVFNNNNNQEDSVVVVHNEIHIKRIQMDVKEIFGIDITEKNVTNWLTQMSFDSLREMFFTLEDDLRNGFCRIKSNPIGFINGCIAKGGYTSMKPINAHTIKQADTEKKHESDYDEIPY